MASDYFLPQAEQAVGNRLAALRRRAGISQEAFGKTIHLSRDQLANIETGRTPLRFINGWLACKKLDVSQLWLSNGLAPVAKFFDIKLGFGDVSVSLTFREACEHPGIAQRLHDLWIPATRKLRLRRFNKKPKHRSEELLLLNSLDHVNALCDDLMHRMSPSSLDVAVSEIEQVLLRHVGERRISQSAEKKILTETSISGKVETVTSQLDSILELFDRLIKQPGNKAALADYLGAPLASVSRWISGKREPGREVTLRMLRWALEQKEQQKRPASASTPAGQKTQSDSSKAYETNKPSPKKR